MAIHIMTGTGAPTLPATPGTHYIDTASGDQYLYGATEWKKIGGSDITVAYADLATSASVALDPANTDTVVSKTPASGNAVLAMDALVAMATPAGWPRRVHFRSAQPFEFSLSGTAPTTRINLDLSGGFTFSGGVISPPAAAASITVELMYLGVPPGFTAKTYVLRCSAQTDSLSLGG